jgi:hypothetical protein
MTRVSSATDRRPGFLNSAATFDVRQRTIRNCAPQMVGWFRLSGGAAGILSGGINQILKNKTGQRFERHRSGGLILPL